MHRRHGLEGITAEVVAGDGNALLGEPGPYQVHLFEIRHQDVGQLQLPGRGGDAPIGGVGRRLGRGGRVHHFPNLGGAMGRVLGQQGVQKGRAAPGQTGDEQRPPDDFSRNARMAPAVLHQPQPVAQQPHRVAVDADTAHEAQLRVQFIRP